MRDHDAAVSLKWQVGRDKYGTAWHGEPPIVEAYAECLDLENYIVQHSRANPDDWRVRLCLDFARCVTKTVAELALDAEREE